MNYEKIFKQFVLDVKRLDLVIDKTNCDEVDVETIREYLSENLNNKEFISAIYTLTQTFLADFYVKEFRKINDVDKQQQLLDHGNYGVDIDTKKKLVHITKEFKIVYFVDDKHYIIDYCALDIDLYLENSKIFYIWSYEFGSSEEPVIIETSTLILEN